MRLTLTVILSFFVALIGTGQEKTRNQPPAAKINTVLWEITGNGLTQASYLFGTMHILCAQDAHLSDSMLYAIEKTSQVYFEVDMDNTAELMGLFKYIRMKDNKKLSDLLTPAEYERVKKYLSENKFILPLSMMERFKPFFIASMLSESKMPCETKNGMEEIIMTEIKKQGKPIKGLESMEFQASVFDSIPYTEQAKELLMVIDSAGKDDSSSSRMLDVYRSQNLDSIEKITLDEASIAGYIDLFLYNRNAKWIPVIQEAMRQAPTLIAVGAAHLPGQKGLIQLLKKAGYRLRPVINAPNQRVI